MKVQEKTTRKNNKKHCLNDPDIVKGELFARLSLSTPVEILTVFSHNLSEQVD
jgi:hypothetical protein